MFNFEQTLAAKAIEEQQLYDHELDGGDRSPLLGGAAPSVNSFEARTGLQNPKLAHLVTIGAVHQVICPSSCTAGALNPLGTGDLSVGVAPHAVAGDLHLPRSTMDVTVPGMAATMSRSALGQPQGLLRIPSTSAGAGVGGSGATTGGGSGQSRQPGTPRRDDMLDDTFIDFDTDLATLRQQKAPFYLQWQFWWTAVPIVLTLGLAATAIAMRVTHPNARILFLETWRWCFFFAGFVPVHYVSEGAVRVAEMIVESKLFTVQQALYFAVSIHKAVARCLRACLALLLFLVSFADGREREEYVQLAWSTVMKILVCLILCSVADVAKTLLAKLLSSHFHKRAHFDKMQDALNKEYFLHALSQPRPHASLDLMRQQCKDELGSSMRRSQSYHGLDPLGIPSAVYGAMHDIHASFLHVAQGVKSKKQGVPSFGALPQSKRASFRTSDGGAAGGLGLCPGGLSPTGAAAAAAHPVISMLAEQETQDKSSSSQGGGQGRSGGPSFRADPKVIKRLHRLEKHMRENKLRHSFADQLGEAQESDELNSKKEAHKLAFYLFWNVRPNFDRNFIVPMDLEFFMPPEKIPQALKALDVDGDGKISLADMRDAVIQIYKERKNLAYTLQDARGVVSKLELIMGVMMHVLFVFFYLIIFDVDVNKVWLSFSSVFLAFVFVFGNSLRNMYESVIFLFVMHPYDVGDALFISNDWCQVEEIALQYTQVVRYDGVKIWYPNYVLCAGAVMNITRSAKRWESFKVSVDISTSPSVFEAVEAAAVAHFKANPSDFSGEKMIIANLVGDPLKYMLCVWWEYAYPGTELGKMGKARSGLYLAVSKILTEHNVVYTLPPYQPANKAASAEQRPVGEGQKFMPPFMQKDHLKL
ncbi:MAG: mechanosensitive channel of small conductance-like 10 [Trebouxia sp. A1-2]|nr:MAG: mechanosensitive channel of small conductance-like 10 [Trebouxia sp. A1-2]